MVISNVLEIQSKVKKQEENIVQSIRVRRKEDGINALKSFFTSIVFTFHNAALKRFLI